MKTLRFLLTTAIILLVACEHNTIVDSATDGSDITILTLTTQSTRTSLGNKVGNTYPVYWSEGDRVVVNGTLSEAAMINPDNPAAAQFTINESLEYPRSILYTDNYTPEYANCVEFPTEQAYTKDGIQSGYAPMYGYVTTASTNIQLKHLATILRFPVKSANDGTTLRNITIETEKGEAISGLFRVECTNGSITATESAESSLSYNANAELSSTNELIFNIVIPKGNYSNFTITFTDNKGGKMVCMWSPTTIHAGVVREFKSITYKAGSTLSLGALGSSYDYFVENQRCSGLVRDTNGKPLSNVVISDGLLCTKTNEHGYYELESDLASSKFIFASIPSGYKARNNSSGVPQFYHRITDKERKEEFCVADFVFEPITGDPNRYTLIVGADPQPRAKTKGDDRVAFHSLDICEDLYLDMRDTRTAITDREVYGMMLGDIVHENMALFTNYVAGIKSTGVQMFNVIGNHDHDLSATTDEEGARRFEEHFGPSYYSFNIGKQHFVVLDNVIMTTIDGKLVKNEYSYGLTDKQWQWLQNDLSYVDKSTTLMVASHIPMFRKDSAEAEYQNQSNHGTDYANLLKQYSKVHAWAGHVHRSFNYNYPSSNALKNIEVHTLARSTGELWTNEYNAYGTPRGYTVVEVDGDNISWKFKPTRYQKAQFVGNQYSTVGTPAYTLRDWNYNADGIAIMKDSGKQLDSSYQMKAWKQGSYIYVHVFMYDNKWSKAKFNGKEMTLLKRYNNLLVANPRDYAYQEIYDFYSVNSILSGYDYAYDPVYHNSIFRTSVSGSGSGTITITDRFGNNFSTSISW